MPRVSRSGVSFGGSRLQRPMPVVASRRPFPLCSRVPRGDATAQSSHPAPLSTPHLGVSGEQKSK